ncbi:MAG TPA: YceI family protein, partial [Ktedonobacteraceae bacterium]
MKRSLWMIGIGIAIVLVLIGAFVSYTAHFASTANPPHKPPGVATLGETPIPSTGLHTFQILPAQSTASYSVRENLIIRNVSNNVAIGRTHAVQGSFEIRTGTSPLVARLNITVDVSTLQTDEPMRDHFVRQNYLETDTYPTATFISTSTQGLPKTYSDGHMVRFQLIGNLTLHGTTNKEVFDVQGKVAGNTITGTATSTIYMTDFGIQPPD